MKTLYIAFVIFIFFFSQNILANKTITSGLLTSNELLNINVTIKDELVEISWDGTAFTNDGYFIIERSDNALTFITLDTLLHSLNNQNYLHIDNLPLMGISYYRIRYKSYNEPEYLSNIFDIEFISKESDENFEVMKIFPIPYYENLSAKVKCKMDMVITVQVIDKSGKVICEYSENCNSGINIIQIPDVVNMINDIYYLIIIDKNMNKKIIHILNQNHN